MLEIHIKGGVEVAHRSGKENSKLILRKQESQLSRPRRFVNVKSNRPYFELDMVGTGGVGRILGARGEKKERPTNSWNTEAEGGGSQPSFVLTPSGGEENQSFFF